MGQMIGNNRIQWVVVAEQETAIGNNNRQEWEPMRKQRVAEMKTAAQPRHGSA